MNDDITITFGEKPFLTLDDRALGVWGKAGLLEGVEDKKTLACALEQQRLYNEQLWDSKFHCVSAFKRTSIEMVRRVIPSLSKTFEVTCGITGKFGKCHEFGIMRGMEWDIYAESNREDWEKYDNRIDYEHHYVEELCNKLVSNFEYFYEHKEKFNFRAFGVNNRYGCNPVVFYGDFA